MSITCYALTSKGFPYDATDQEWKNQFRLSDDCVVQKEVEVIDDHYNDVGFIKNRVIMFHPQNGAYIRFDDNRFFADSEQVQKGFWLLVERDTYNKFIYLRQFDGEFNYLAGDLDINDRLTLRERVTLLKGSSKDIAPLRNFLKHLSDD